LLIAAALLAGCGSATKQDADTQPTSGGAPATFPIETAGAECASSDVEPDRITLACADAGSVAHNLKWTDWGEPVADATGTLTLNDCIPYCARGTYHDYPVHLILSGLKECPYGRTRQYTELSLEFPDRDPGDDPLEFHGPKHGTYPC
jgi:hypothetical protein